MSAELKHAILCECIGQLGLHAEHDQYDVDADFRMAHFDMTDGNEKAIFKLALVHGIQKGEAQ